MSYVTAYEYSDGDWNWYQDAYTDPLGDYDIAGLPPAPTIWSSTTTPARI